MSTQHGTTAHDLQALIGLMGSATSDPASLYELHNPLTANLERLLTVRGIDHLELLDPRVPQGDRYIPMSEVLRNQPWLTAVAIIYQGRRCVALYRDRWYAACGRQGHAIPPTTPASSSSTPLRAPLRQFANRAVRRSIHGMSVRHPGPHAHNVYKSFVTLPDGERRLVGDAVHIIATAYERVRAPGPATVVRVCTSTTLVSHIELRALGGSWSVVYGGIITIRTPGLMLAEGDIVGYVAPKNAPYLHMEVWLTPEEAVTAPTNKLLYNTLVTHFTEG